MSKPVNRFFIALLTAPVSLVPLDLEAQGVSMAATCSEGWSTLGSLGITEFSCDCTFDRDANPAWRFRGEPQVRAVSSSGPATGRLRAGDVLVAIDGMLITTRAAGARLAHLRAGVPVTLTVRRGNREIEVRIVPDEPCEPPVPPTPPAAPVATSRGGVPTPRPPRAVTAPSARMPTPAPPGLPAPPAPMGWFGFGISCRNCEMNVVNYSAIEQAEEELRALRESHDDDSAPVRAALARVRNLRRENTRWRFSEYPTLFAVDPGSPAYDAGLRRGDALLRIDDVSLLTEDGAGRFSQVEPGQTVRFTYRRGGSERTVEVRAIERPDGGQAGVSAGALNAALASLERTQAEHAEELEVQAARLQRALVRAEGSAGGGREQELVELRAQLDRLNTTHSTESQAQIERLRAELALMEQARAGHLTPAPEADQHLRFAGSVGNTEVEVRGLSSVVVSYDNSTGELLIRTIDSTIRVKAPGGRR